MSDNTLTPSKEFVPAKQMYNPTFGLVDDLVPEETDYIIKSSAIKNSMNKGYYLGADGTKKPIGSLDEASPIAKLFGFDSNGKLLRATNGKGELEYMTPVLDEKKENYILKAMKGTEEDILKSNASVISSYGMADYHEGFLKSFSKGLYNTVRSTGNSLAQGAEMINQITGGENKELSKFASEMGAEQEINKLELSEDAKKGSFDNMSSFGTASGSAVGSTLQTLPLGGLTGLAYKAAGGSLLALSTATRIAAQGSIKTIGSLATFTGSSVLNAGEVWEIGKKNGLNKEDNAKLAALTGVLNGALEVSFGPNIVTDFTGRTVRQEAAQTIAQHLGKKNSDEIITGLMPNIISKAKDSYKTLNEISKNRLTNGAKGFVEEGFEEFTQGQISNSAMALYDMFLDGNEPKYNKKLLSKESLISSLEEGLLGGIVGGGMGLTRKGNDDTSLHELISQDKSQVLFEQLDILKNNNKITEDQYNNGFKSITDLNDLHIKNVELGTFSNAKEVDLKNSNTKGYIPVAPIIFEAINNEDQLTNTFNKRNQDIAVLKGKRDTTNKPSEKSALDEKIKALEILQVADSVKLKEASELVDTFRNGKFNENGELEEILPPLTSVTENQPPIDPSSPNEPELPNNPVVSAIASVGTEGSLGDKLQSTENPIEILEGIKIGEEEELKVQPLNFKDFFVNYIKQGTPAAITDDSITIFDNVWTEKNGVIYKNGEKTTFDKKDLKNLLDVYESGIRTKKANENIAKLREERDEKMAREKALKQDESDKNNKITRETINGFEHVFSIDEKGNKSLIDITKDGNSLKNDNFDINKIHEKNLLADQEKQKIENEKFQEELDKINKQKELDQLPVDEQGNIEDPVIITDKANRNYSAPIKSTFDKMTDFIRSLVKRSGSSIETEKMYTDNYFKLLASGNEKIFIKKEVVAGKPQHNAYLTKKCLPTEKLGYYGDLVQNIEKLKFINDQELEESYFASKNDLGNNLLKSIEENYTKIISGLNERDVVAVDVKLLKFDDSDKAINLKQDKIEDIVKRGYKIDRFVFEDVFDRKKINQNLYSKFNRHKFYVKDKDNNYYFAKSKIVSLGSVYEFAKSIADKNPTLSEDKLNKLVTYELSKEFYFATNNNNMFFNFYYFNNNGKPQITVRTNLKESKDYKYYNNIIFDDNGITLSNGKDIELKVSSIQYQRFNLDSFNLFKIDPSKVVLLNRTEETQLSNANYKEEKVNEEVKSEVSESVIVEEVDNNSDFDENEAKENTFKLASENQKLEKTNFNQIKKQLSKILPSFIGLGELKNSDSSIIGQYLNKFILLAQLTEKGTEYHEAFHAVFRNVFNPNEINTLYNYAKVKIGKKRFVVMFNNISSNELYSNLNNEQTTNLVYEEYLADLFQKYAVLNDGFIKSTLFDEVKDLFNKLARAIKEFINNLNLFPELNTNKYAKEILEDVLKGKYVKSKEVNYDDFSNIPANKIINNNYISTPLSLANNIFEQIVAEYIEKIDDNYDLIVDPTLFNEILANVRSNKEIKESDFNKVYTVNNYKTPEEKQAFLNSIGYTKTKNDIGTIVYTPTVFGNKNKKILLDNFNSLIKYHNKGIKQFDEIDEETIKSKSYDLSPNEESYLDKVSEEVKFFVKFTNFETSESNEFGEFVWKKLIDFSTTYNLMLRNVVDYESFPAMIKKWKSLNDTGVNAVLAKLEKLKNNDLKKYQDLENKFFKSFSFTSLQGVSVLTNSTDGGIDDYYNHTINNQVNHLLEIAKNKWDKEKSLKTFNLDFFNISDMYDEKDGNYFINEDRLKKSKIVKKLNDLGIPVTLDYFKDIINEGINGDTTRVKEFKEFFYGIGTIEYNNPDKKNIIDNNLRSDEKFANTGYYRLKRFIGDNLMQYVDTTSNTTWMCVGKPKWSFMKPNFISSQLYNSKLKVAGNKHINSNNFLLQSKDFLKVKLSEIGYYGDNITDSKSKELAFKDFSLVEYMITRQKLENSNFIVLPQMEAKNTMLALDLNVGINGRYRTRLFDSELKQLGISEDGKLFNEFTNKQFDVFYNKDKSFIENTIKEMTTNKIKKGVHFTDYYDISELNDEQIKNLKLFGFSEKDGKHPLIKIGNMHYPLTSKMRDYIKSEDNLSIQSSLPRGYKYVTFPSFNNYNTHLDQDSRHLFYRDFIEQDVVQSNKQLDEVFNSYTDPEKRLELENKLMYKNAESLMKNFIMLESISDILIGSKNYYKNNSDVTKRLAGLWATGDFLSEETFKVAVGQDIETVNQITGKKNTASTDAQGYVTASRWKFIMKNLNKLPVNLESIVDDLINGIPISLEDQTKLMKHATANSIKNVYYDGDVYIKCSVIPLFKEMTSAKGFEELNALRLQMEEKGIDEFYFESAFKKLKPILSLTNNDKHLDLQPFELNNKYWRLQVENPSGKQEGTLGTQILQLIDSELLDTDTTLLNGVVVNIGELRKEYESDLNEIKNQEYNLSQAIENSIVNGESVGLKELQESANNNSAANNLSELLESKKDNTKETLSKDRGEYSLNLPMIAKKYEEKILSNFNKKVLSQKTNQLKCSLISSFGVKNPYTGEALKIHKTVDGKLQYAEVLLSEELLFQNGLTKEDIFDKNGKYVNGAEEIMTMLGFRIPTQSHHSMIPFKVVGFIPAYYGSSIIAPADITYLSGADYDIDSLFIMFKKFRVIKDKDKNTIKIQAYNKNNVTIEDHYDYYLNKKEIKPVFKENLKEYNKEKEILDDLKLNLKNKKLLDLTSGKESDFTLLKLEIYNLKDKLKNDYLEIQRQTLEQFNISPDIATPNKNHLFNNILDIYFLFLNANSKILEESLSTPASLDGFRDQKDYYAKRNILYKQEVSFNLNSNIIEQWVNTSTGKQNIGVSALENVTSASLTKYRTQLPEFNQTDFFNKDVISYEEQEIEDIELENGKLVDNKSRFRKADMFSSLVSGMTDNAKEILAYYLNLNKTVLGIVGAGVSTGIGVNKMLLFVNHPYTKSLNSLFETNIFDRKFNDIEDKLRIKLEEVESKINEERLSILLEDIEKKGIMYLDDNWYVSNNELNYYITKQFLNLYRISNDMQKYGKLLQTNKGEYVTVEENNKIIEVYDDLLKKEGYNKTLLLNGNVSENIDLMERISNEFSNNLIQYSENFNKAIKRINKKVSLTKGGNKDLSKKLLSYLIVKNYYDTHKDRFENDQALIFDDIDSEKNIQNKFDLIKKDLNEKEYEKFINNKFIQRIYVDRPNIKSGKVSFFKTNAMMKLSNLDFDITTGAVAELVTSPNKYIKDFGLNLMSQEIIKNGAEFGANNIINYLPSKAFKRLSDSIKLLEDDIIVNDKFIDDDTINEFIKIYTAENPYLVESIVIEDKDIKKDFEKLEITISDAWLKSNKLLDKQFIKYNKVLFEFKISSNGYSTFKMFNPLPETKSLMNIYTLGTYNNIVEKISKLNYSKKEIQQINKEKSNELMDQVLEDKSIFNESAITDALNSINTIEELDDFYKIYKTEEDANKVKHIFDKRREEIEVVQKPTQPSTSVEEVLSETAETIYSKLGKTSSNANVEIDNVSGIKASTKRGIVAYRTQGNNFLKAFNEDRTIGNPWNRRGYGLYKTNSIKESVIEFTKWLTGEAHYDKLQDYRQAILDNINNLKGKKIIYYEELREPSHATALDYLINKYNWNIQGALSNLEQEQLKKFAELQKLLNNKEFIEGAKFAYESSEGLKSWGTQEQYNDYVARVSVGLVRNPTNGEFNSSDVKNIVYHGTPYEFDTFLSASRGVNTGKSTTDEKFDSELATFFTDSEYTAHSYSLIGTQKKRLAIANALFKLFMSNNMQEDYNIIKEKFPEIVPQLKALKEKGLNTKDSITSLEREYSEMMYTDIINMTDYLRTEKDISNEDKQRVQKKIEELVKKGGFVNNTKRVILNIQNPIIKDFDGQPFVDQPDGTLGSKTELTKLVNTAIKNSNDAVIANNIKDPGIGTNYAIIDTKNAHILGGKQDIQGFKEFVGDKQTNLKSNSNNLNNNTKFEEGIEYEQYAIEHKESGSKEEAIPKEVFISATEEEKQAILDQLRQSCKTKPNE